MHANVLSLLVAASLAAAVPASTDRRGGDYNGDYGSNNSSGRGCGHRHKSLTTLAATATATANPTQYTSTATDAVAAAAATAKTESPTSHVKGKAFSRIMQIYLETTAYNNTIAEPNCRPLIESGLLLTNMYGVAAPSQPNYVAPASGDYFGTNSDSFLLVDRNVSTIVDLLEDRGVSWGDYNEGLPYSGFEGFRYENLAEGNYERKHNLLVRFNSVSEDADRLAKVKNLTLFNEDLAANRLPQWIFVTPNLYNNGHDTNISVSCNWTNTFVQPLLKNSNFNDGNTLIYITWQANGQYPTERNHVAGIMLGSALPKHLVNKTDDSYYNHYSELSSVEANWGLHTLGRWDVGANVWRWVGKKTGDRIREWSRRVAGDSFENYYWNQSYGGVFSSANTTSHSYVAPNLRIRSPGTHRTVLPAIARLWAGSSLPDYYRDVIEVPDALHPPKGFEVPVGLSPAEPITTPITAYPAQATATSI